jgi:hypothetical protein
MSLQGTCLCGAVHVSVKSEKPTLFFCHCKNCHKVAGSLFTHNMIVKNDEVNITGDLGVYIDSATDSGKPLQRFFCKNCGK